MTTRIDWKEPFTRFGEIFEEAKRVISKDPNAFSLATVDGRGRPSVRVMLLKDFDHQGFVFYTNHQSAKGEALRNSKVAALNFYWPALDQQIRIEGSVELGQAAEADAYFATRPRIAQLGAWASAQSRPLASREALEERLAALTAQYEGMPVPRPEYWAGFRLVPERFEFWRAHEFRLHWREQYVKSGGGWERGWLNP